MENVRKNTSQNTSNWLMYIHYRDPTPPDFFHTLSRNCLFDRITGTGNGTNGH